MSAITLLTGQILAFDHSPFAGDPLAAARLHEALLIENGRIIALGTARDLRAQAPQARVTDMGTHLITAGFVDAHVHYPQTAIIASWGKRLIEWLNTYTFPEEMRFADPAYAAEIATRYLDLMLAHGTTTCATPRNRPMTTASRCSTAGTGWTGSLMPSHPGFPPPQPPINSRPSARSGRNTPSA
jgi:guanine deaminase